ncbi:MAG: dipeptidase [Actinomycetota bacterium]|nr:dipeptidase [Actinomycetota bacterium]
MFDLYRDHCEGTPFDLIRGTAAGPYGDPTRLVGPYDGKQNNLSNVELREAWERPISVFYQGFTTVCQSRDEKEVPAATSGLIWFGPGGESVCASAVAIATVVAHTDSPLSAKRVHDPVDPSVDDPNPLIQVTDRRTLVAGAVRTSG